MADAPGIGKKLLDRLTLGTVSKPARFVDVLKEEQKDIRERRARAGIPAPTPEPKPEPEPEPLRDLTGLALSGGGIRSATFCLGFLQALRQKGVLRYFDYLSTVSGGGFIGGWWSAWLTRNPSEASASRPRS